jgi:hypothetical protein
MCLPCIPTLSRFKIQLSDMSATIDEAGSVESLVKDALVLAGDFLEPEDSQLPADLNRTF